MVKTILTFSPKGGVGTSIITANMAIYLAQKGKKVLLMDAAPNAGTLHFYINQPAYAVSLKQYDHFSVLPLSSTDYQNLKFFSNLKGDENTGRVSEYLVKWETELKQINFDYIFIDMGSSISDDLLESAEHVDMVLLFTTLDPLSIEKSNYFFKRLFRHRLRSLQDTHDLQHILTSMQQENERGYLFTPRNLLVRLSEIVPHLEEEIYRVVAGVRLGVIYNHLSGNNDLNFMNYYHLVISNYFGFRPQTIGELRTTEVITTAVQQMVPVVTHEKSGEFQELLRIATSRLATVLSL